ncbi:MAG TPA: cation diffusion facilitator family transporter [Syntrophorhabdaceae bacterium]|jgi:cation diffusion facilitator family transporter
MATKEQASLFAILSALVLALCKFGTGLISGSMTVISSGLDSLLDALMSLMNLITIRKASKPADREHQYGHGRLEDLAAVIQSSVIIATGGAILYKAVDKLLHKGTISYSGVDLGVMVLSLLFSIAVSRVLKKVGTRTGSQTLMADALHYTSDLYSNTAAIGAIIVTYFTGITSFDFLFSVIIGLIIIVSAIKILRRGIAGLIDTRIPQKVEMKIRFIIEKTPYPCAGYHKLRSRLAGSTKYIDFHLLICRDAGIETAHELASNVEREIVDAIKPIDVVIHIEPCVIECDLTEMTCRIRQHQGAVAAP